MEDTNLGSGSKCQDEDPSSSFASFSKEATDFQVLSAINSSLGEITNPCQSPWNNATRDENATDISPPVYLYVYASVASFIIFLIGVLGNLLVIFVVVRLRSMRTRMNYFLVSLSIADLMVLFVCQPVALLDLFAKERWLLGAFMCKAIPFLENTALHCSVLSLLTIGMERYVAICHPLLATRRCQSHMPAIILTWTISATLCLPFIFISSLEEADYSDGSKPWTCRTKTETRLAQVFIVTDFALCMVLPFFAITFFYSAIIFTMSPFRCWGKIRNKFSSLQPIVLGRRNTRTKRRHQVIRMMVAVVAIFYICLLPLRITSIWLVFEYPGNVEQMGFHNYLNLLNMARLLMFVNSASNPIVYGLMCSKFRKAFATTLPCLHRQDNNLATPVATSTKLQPLRCSSRVKSYREVNGIEDSHEKNNTEV